MEFLHKLHKHVPPKYWPKWVHRKWLDKKFFDVFERTINWKKPTTFNEKINWYMINFSDPIGPILGDKIAVKDYVREKLGEGYTAKTLAIWNKKEDIDFSDLTPPFVLKSNCSENDGYLYIIQDNKFDEQDIKSKLTECFDWRNTNQNGSCFASHKIVPRVFAEEFLGSPDAPMLDDYKIFCFNGEPYCVYFDKRSKGISFYDLEWKPIDVQYCNFTRPTNVEKPAHFDEMIRVAKILSKGFPFLRVDLYDLPDGIRVGELTLFTSNGRGRFSPESFDNELGEKFILSTHRTEK